MGMVYAAAGCGWKGWDALHDRSANSRREYAGLRSTQVDCLAPMVLHCRRKWVVLDMVGMTLRTTVKGQLPTRSARRLLNRQKEGHAANQDRGSRKFSG